MKKGNAIIHINGWFKYIDVSSDELKMGYIKTIFPPPCTAVLNRLEKLDRSEISIPYQEIIVYYTGKKINGYYLFEY